MSGRRLLTPLALVAVSALLSTACQDAPGSGATDDTGPTIDSGLAPEEDMGEGDSTMADLGTDDMGIPILDMEVFTDFSRPDDDGGLTDAGPLPPLPEACLMPPAPPEQPALALEARCRAGGALRIRDLRDRRCPDAPVFRDANGDGFSDTRIDVVLPEARVTAVFADAFAVQDPEGGAWSGLWVFMNRTPIPAGVVPGARVRLSGSFFEYFTLSEMQPDDDGVQVIGPGEVPEPVLIADAARLAGGDLVEPFENMLVEVQNVSVRQTEPDCPRSFDMFVVGDGLRVEDEVELAYEPSRADLIERVVGVLHFSFETWKIRPRSDADLTWVHCGGVPDKCEAAECGAEQGAAETRALIITEIMDDPRGMDAEREWVELYNPGPGDLNLAGWRLESCNGQRSALSGRVPANSRIVVAASLDEDANGGVEADLLLDGLNLPNGEGSLLVFDADEQLVDQVRYSLEAPWPLRQSGQSLELTAPAADNSNGAAWQAGRRDYGPGGQGTPGR